MGRRTINFLHPIPHFPLTATSSAAESEHIFDIAFQVMAHSAGLSVVAAEERASVVLLTVVATEPAAPSGLRGGVVLFDC